MQIVHPRCAGLDIHKKSIVVYIRLASTDETITTHTRTFGTTTDELLTMVGWLRPLEVTNVVMESTGKFWSRSITRWRTASSYRSST